MTTESLVERARLDDAEQKVVCQSSPCNEGGPTPWDGKCFGECREQQLKAAKSKALWAAVDWLFMPERTTTCGFAGLTLQDELEAAGLERP